MSAPNRGAGVDIYLLGAHILRTHQEVVGRVTNVNTFALETCPGEAFPFGNNHDTGVASLAVGSTVGVASDANLVNVTLLDLATVPTYVQQHFEDGLTATTNRINANRPRSAIVLCTLQVYQPANVLNTLLDAVLDAADTLFISSAAQIHYLQPETVNDYWPNRVSRVFEIGATEMFDQECSANNTGHGLLNPCGFDQVVPRTDLYAPGYQLRAAQVRRKGCDVTETNMEYTNLYSGTSASAPLVAGVAAIFLSPNTTYWPHWYQVEQALIQMSSPNTVITLNPGATRKSMLYNMFRALPISRNGASFKERCAPDSLYAIFGNYPMVPNRVFLNYEVAGEVECTITYADNGQVNVWCPNGPTGTHAIKVYRDTNLLGYGAIKHDNVATAFYTQNGLGNGLVSGLLYKYNSTTGAFEGSVSLSSAGVGWGANQTAYLVLFGTAFRRRTSTPTATIGGISSPVIFAGDVPGYLGLDQANIGPLSDSLKNSGVKTIVMTSDGVQSQPNVTVTFSQ